MTKINKRQTRTGVNYFKVSKKNIRTISLTSFGCPSDSITDFDWQYITDFDSTTDNISD